jgi:hypothetical protein
MISYSQACLDTNLFGEWFSGPTWAVWRVLDKAIFGEKLDDAELEIFHKLCGNRPPLDDKASEVWLALGRRSAKTLKAASLCVYQCTINADKFKNRLQRGERAVAQLLAVDREQARVAFNFVSAFFEKPLLKRFVKRATRETIELRNGFAIEVMTNDQRRVRGRAVVLAVFEEVAHWRSENSVSPDADVYEAIAPAMAQFGGDALLLGISSTYARKGLLWRKHGEHFGKPGPVLVARAATWDMNPNLPRDSTVIAEAYKRDASWANAEFGSLWRDDIEQFVSLTAIQSCIKEGVRERQPERQHRYVAAVDPAGSGGPNADSMTLAISHRAGDTTILDLLREVRPPFSPEAVAEEFATLCRRYRISKIVGDRWGGEWCREQFRKHGVFYELADGSKSDFYRDLLPLINSGAADLLDDERLVNQLVSLERRVTRNGRDVIDHPVGPQCHDDVANVAALALVQAFHKTHPRQSWERHEPRFETVSSGGYTPHDCVRAR